jgi:hypothetical protein
MKFLRKLFGKPEPGELRALQPQNLLETILRDVCAGTERMELFVRTLLASKLFVPSLMDPETLAEGTAFKPVIVATPDGPMLVAYTAPTRAPHEGAAGSAESAIYVDAPWLLRTIPPGIGMVINPGWDVAISMPAAGLAEFKKDYGLTDLADPGVAG